MKRIIGFLSALVLMFSLSACGVEGDSNESKVDPLSEEYSYVDDFDHEVTQIAPGEGPQSKSNISLDTKTPMVRLNNGVYMPRFGFGTQIQSLENGSRQTLNATVDMTVTSALQNGYRHLDTAHAYFNEKGVGYGIIHSGVPREEIWITSKLDPNEYVNAENAIEEILERLQIDYLDLLYLHHPAGTIANIVSAYQAVEEAYKEGKARAIGISNFDNRMEAYNAIMKEEIKPQVMQIECHPYAQRNETRELAKEHDIQVECWYPLKHASSGILSDDVLQGIADNHGKSVAQVILRWHIQEGLCPVPGSTNPSHIAENIDIFDFELSGEEMNEIRSLDKGNSGRSFNIQYGTQWWTNLSDYDYVPEE